MKIVKISVTQEDIDRGRALSCTECPVALAIQRALPGKYVEVEASDIWFGESDRDGEFIPTPDAAAEFMLRFDERKPVEPFEFDLAVPG